MENREYFLGLDIGTDSIGWAVTDSGYHVVKKNGQALWGVRLFDSAKTAAERRSFRSARRRIERRKQRIQWLQEIFAGEIAKVDPAFFLRLQESKFMEEDKCKDLSLGKYTLFDDPNYCDVDFHRQFPTIYHLRKRLIESSQPFDVRLVYLALHHIMKNRGHFLYGDVSMDSISLEEGCKRLAAAVEMEYELPLVAGDLGQLREALLSRTEKKSWRKKTLARLFAIPSGDSRIAVVELLSGSKVSLDALFGDGTSNEELSKVCLADDFDAVEDKLVAMLGDRIELILAVKEIYDWALLETMREGQPYLSFAKVLSYEKHREDLRSLKRAVKALDAPALHQTIFHKTQKNLNNYVAYSGKDAKGYRCNYDEFRKYLTASLKPWKDKSEIRDILEQLEKGTFLPKQTSKDNGVIPHQLHEAELIKILENASHYLPFLLERDESGLTRAEQIHQMFCFRVPYYVGPLNSRSRHSWVVRKNEKLFPWNFESVVDLEACRRGFVRRMTAKCSYIGEDVLPLNSLLYTRFLVLNTINKLKVNGKNISIAQKQRIYQDVFLTRKNVSAATLRTYLQLGKEDALTGFDQELKVNLAPWKQFDWLLQRPVGMEAAEDIILHSTLFGQDHKLLQGWIQKQYGNMLTAEEQKRALRYRYSGWGRLSRIFLTEIYHIDSNTGEAFSLMDMLWNTNQNLMELLGNKYTFAKAVEEYRRRKEADRGKTLREYLAESYASPAIKRSIHQVIGIAGEIQSIMKRAPKRIFVEMAREKGEKGKRPVSRKAALMALYQKCEEEAGPLFAQLPAEDEGNLRRDKLYLYYSQLGKCMYSGEAIDLNRIDSDYDIDHIYPQSITKDDSIRNRVLVKRQLNAAKADNYPISIEIRQKMRPFWAALEKKGLIPREKLDRLLRATPFSSDERAGFIARQLVETRQSCKIVADLLQRRFGEQTEIVYVKAGNVSFFRQDQRLTADGRQLQAGQCRDLRTEQDPLFAKCREINDFHHAKDAYLNIVVGNVYHMKFTRNPANFLKQRDAKYSLNRMFDFDVQRNGELAWKAGENGSITVVRHVMGKNNILLTRRASEAHGSLFDQQIVSHGRGQTPVKQSDPRLATGYYGEYNRRTGAYFFLVEHTNQNKRVRSIEPVYLMNLALYERDPIAYCQEILDLHAPCILIPRIKINSLVSIDGFRMHISGRTGSRISYKNANPLILSPMWNQYIKQISKYLERCKLAGRELEITRFDRLTIEKNQKLYGILLEKLENRLYKCKFETVAITLRESQEKFNECACATQCKILLQILNIFANNASSADLKELNGKTGIGILLTSKNLDNYKTSKFYLINQSITGFFEQKVDLLAEVFQ